MKMKRKSTKVNKCEVYFGRVWQTNLGMAPRHIAILGGGITGLSSAFYLSRRFPNSLITLLEKSSRLGGWIRSERVQVQDGNGTPASVVLEYGPRTLRPNSKALLELVRRNTLMKCRETPKRRK